MASYSARLSPHPRATAARSLTKRARKVASFRMWYIISFVGSVLSQRSPFPIVALRPHAVRPRARSAQRRGEVGPVTEQQPRLARIHDLLDPEAPRGTGGGAGLGGPGPG